MNIDSQSLFPVATAHPLTEAFNRSSVRYGRDRLKLGELPVVKKNEILTKITAIIDIDLIKYRPYFVHQVAAGHIRLMRMGEDRLRINTTIRDFAHLAKSKKWTKSKDIYSYKDWRELEQLLKAFKTETAADYEIPDLDSRIIYTAQYLDPGAVALAAALGKIAPTATSTYWFRQILTPQGAFKYGRGTSWCTNTDPVEWRERFGSVQHPSINYIRQGLYIIERATPSLKRQPILQLSGIFVMATSDSPITALSPRLKCFLRETLKTAAVDKRTARKMQEIAT